MNPLPVHLVEPLLDYPQQQVAVEPKLGVSVELAPASVAVFVLGVDDRENEAVPGVPPRCQFQADLWC